MLLLLQILALLQLVFLPGYFLFRLIRARSGLFRTLLFSFAFSGPMNFLLTLLLVSVGFFDQTAVLLMVATEIAGILFLVFRRKERMVFSSPPPDLFLWMKQYFSSLGDGVSRRTALLFGLAAVFGLAAFILNLPEAFSQTFTRWDSALSWNRWALEWFAGFFPHNTMGYPQLAPCNWAMAYAVIGEPLAFVPHGVCLLFPVAVLMMWTDLAFEYRSPGLFLGTGLCAFFLSNVDYPAFGGEADFYVIFYSSALFYSLFLARRMAETGLKDEASGTGFYLFAACLSASSAAAAKPSGLILWILLPVFAACFLRGKEEKKQPELRKTTLFSGKKWKKSIRMAWSSFRPVRRLLPLWLGCGLLIAAPFYVYFGIQVHRGNDRTRLMRMVDGIYGCRSRTERAVASAKLFFARLELGCRTGVPSPRWADIDRKHGFLNGIFRFLGRHAPAVLGAFLLTALLLLSACRDPIWRGMTLYLVVPWILIWSVTFCYDLRNLGPVIPLFAGAMGIGIWNLVGFCARKRILGRVLILLFLLVLPVAAFSVCSDGSIRAAARESLRSSGDPELNRNLYACDRIEPFRGKIASDYEFLRLLPEFRSGFFYFEYSASSPEALENHRVLLKDDSVTHFLVPDYAAPPLRAELGALMKNGTLERLFRSGEYECFRKRKGVTR